MPMTYPAPARRLSLTWCLVLVSLLSACTHVPPEDKAALNQQAAFRHATTTQPYTDAAWWSALGDDKLAALMTQAMTHNTEVRTALQRLRQARAGESARSSALWPTLALTGSASNERTGFPDAVKQGAPDKRVLRAGLDLSWELDVFGRNRVAAEAAEHDALAAQAGVYGAQLMVMSEVAQQYVTLQAARERLRLVQSLIAAQQSSVDILTKRRQAGLEGNLPLQTAQADLAQLRSNEPGLGTLIEVTQSRLAMLLATRTSELQLGSQTTPVWLTDHAPADLFGAAPPVGLPLELLTRRPDVMANRQQWLAEAAREQSARTDLLPRFFASAITGRQDVKLNALDLAPVFFTQSALAFTLPLFNAGRVQANIEVQSAQAHIAELAYEKSVRQAIEDVDNALTAWRQDNLRAMAINEALTARRAAMKQVTSLYREGQVSALDVRLAERGQLAAELERIDTRTQQAFNLIQLYKALGGGWSAPTSSASLHTTP
ncbi:MAG: TolC family protein [Aquabacterium sp.]|nr:TolC family protein [Aquabacterium sp.]